MASAFLQEFKKFAMRGNVVDMAVGIIIGAAFGKIVSSLVNDVIMPPVGYLIGSVDFSHLVLTLGDAEAGTAVTLRYGAFISTVLDFALVAFCIFLLVKGMNRLRREDEPAPAAPTARECPKCCSTIALMAVRCPHCTADIGPA